MKSYRLVAGVGNYELGTACVMSAAVAKFRLSLGEPLGSACDTLECACPFVSELLIRFNDSLLFKTDEQRTEVLTPFIDKIIGSRNNDLLDKRIDIYLLWLAKKTFESKKIDFVFPDTLTPNLARELYLKVISHPKVYSSCALTKLSVCLGVYPEHSENLMKLLLTGNDFNRFTAITDTEDVCSLLNRMLDD